ncbi:MAG TPA: element excision factor XisI family protein [Stenomitos sp.]
MVEVFGWHDVTPLSLLKRILAEYIELCSRRPNPELETFLIEDERKEHYIWMNLGWQNGEWVTGMTVYIRICDGNTNQSPRPRVPASPCQSSVGSSVLRYSFER